MQTYSNNNKTRTAPNNVLSAGFRCAREQNRFAKLIAIVTVYNIDPDWEDGVKDAVKTNCQKQADRLKFPDGWQSIGSYDSLKKWFFKNCR